MASHSSLTLQAFSRYLPQDWRCSGSRSVRSRTIRRSAAKVTIDAWASRAKETRDPFPSRGRLHDGRRARLQRTTRASCRIGGGDGDRRDAVVHPLAPPCRLVPVAPVSPGATGFSVVGFDRGDQRVARPASADFLVRHPRRRLDLLPDVRDQPRLAATFGERAHRDHADDGYGIDPSSRHFGDAADEPVRKTEDASNAGSGSARFPAFHPSRRALCLAALEPAAALP